jgi:predicted ArsR family transcriptional regulator
MNGLHSNQKRILEYLLDHADGATIEALVTHLGVTKTAVKEHILKIEHLGYITYKDVSGAIGRPKRYYLLSNNGHEAFPRQYSWLSNILLELLAKNMGKESVSKIMDELAQKVFDSMQSRFTRTNSSVELLVEINKALNELGYRTSLRQKDLRKGAILEATNCVYHSVAKEHPVLCKFDIQFIKKASGGLNVSLESCIAKGDSVCRFCIRNKGLE